MPTSRSKIRLCSAATEGLSHNRVVPGYGSQASLKKYRSLKIVIQKKVDLIIANPLPLGEPLKGNFRGYYSAPVKNNFLIIYLYGKACRRKKDQDIVLCHDGPDCGDDTLKFIDFGPHDQAYRQG